MAGEDEVLAYFEAPPQSQQMKAGRGFGQSCHCVSEIGRVD